MSSSLQTLSTDPKPEAPQGLALWSLGFRPFYLLASSFAALSILAWAAQYTELLPMAYVQGPGWHGHEMLVGFVTAVIAGFLLTAVPNWTGQPTPKGGALAALALLWLSGRVLVLTPFATVSMFVNAAFPVAIAISIAIPLWRSDNRRNYFFVVLLTAMGGVILAVHLALGGAIVFPARAGLMVGLDLVLFVMAVVGGRVIPMFTNNGVPGAGATRLPLVEKVALGSLLALLAADVFRIGPVAPIILGIAAAAHLARLLFWHPWRTLGNPLVWILHAAYAWIVVHLVLRMLAALGLVPESVAIHALTIGAIGGLTLGMMTRTARGHTGRALKADRFEVAAFVLVQLAALARVLGALFAPGAYAESVALSSLLWSAAYGIYAVRYWPILTRSRLDGKPG